MVYGFLKEKENGCFQSVQSWQRGFVCEGCAGFGFAELCQPDLGSPDPPSCPQEPAVPGWGRWPLPFPVLSFKPAGMFWIFIVYLLYSKYLKHTLGQPSLHNWGTHSVREVKIIFFLFKSSSKWGLLPLTTHYAQKQCRTSCAEMSSQMTITEYHWDIFGEETGLQCWAQSQNFRKRDYFKTRKFLPKFHIVFSLSWCWTPCL